MVGLPMNTKWQRRRETMETALTRLMGLSSEEREEKGIVYTPGEIYNQVELWSDTFRRFKRRQEELADFLTKFRNESHRSAVCTGAGTSEFVGYCIEALMRQKLGVPVNVISTPKIVTTPQDFFIDGYATLLVSFARSGNSPESLGAVKIADMLSKNIYHLVITCNEQGALYSEICGRDNSAALVLDEKTNDRGLAMTAAFSNMLVAGQMLSHLFSFQEYEVQFDKLLQAGAAMRDQAPAVLEEISRLGFDRAVFLGDGGNYGTAVESHLKLQELTAGQVMCTWDTFPGLRHGPEAVVDPNTLVVAYLAADGYTQRYELDLLQEIRDKRIGKALLTVAHAVPDEVKEISDYTIEYGPQSDPVPDDLIPPAYIIVGQLLGLFTSLRLGLRPDSPSESGIIHRIVEGVKVYDPLVYSRTGQDRVLAER
jgi:tagatose-6-phosphate ketose/aldose isomerase